MKEHRSETQARLEKELAEENKDESKSRKRRKTDEENDNGKEDEEADDEEFVDEEDDSEQGNKKVSMGQLMRTLAAEWRELVIFFDFYFIF